MLAKPKPRDGEAEALGRAASLDALYGHLPAEKIVELSIREEFAGGIAAVSSFGAIRRCCSTSSRASTAICRCFSSIPASISRRRWTTAMRWSRISAWPMSGC